MSKFRLAALAATMLAGTALPVCAATPLSNFDSITQATLRIVVKNADNSMTGGTGWVIEAASPDRKAGNATVVTALHVVAEGAQVVVVEVGGQARPATVSYIDKARDLAFLEVKDLHAPAMPLTTALPKIGSGESVDSLRASGFANASDEQDANTLKDPAAMVTGSLSRVIRGNNQVDLIQHSIPINPGFSGGPVVDDCGRVVGVNLRDGGHLALVGGTTVPLSLGIAVAVQADEIAKVADEARVKATLDTSACSLAVTTVTHVEEHQQVHKADFFRDALAFIESVRGIAAIASVVILAGAGFALWRLFSGPGAAPVQSPPPPPAATPVPTPSTRRRISLTGREPQTGSLIDLNFTSDELRDPGKVLGREAEARVPDNREKPFVGRSHVRLRYNGQDFEVTDLQSVNKTWLNDPTRSGPAVVPGERVILHDGATLSLYDVNLKVRID